MLMMTRAATRFTTRSLIGLFLLLAPFAVSATTVDSSPRLVLQVKTESAYGELPMSFEVNQGQTDAQVKFISRGAGYSLFLTPSEAVFSLGAGLPKADKTKPYRAQYHDYDIYVIKFGE